MKSFLIIQLFIFLLCFSAFAKKPKALFRPGEFVVRLNPSNNFSALSSDSLGRILGGVIKKRSNGLPNLLVLEKDASLEQVAADFENGGLVEDVEPNYTYKLDMIPNDPDYKNSWGLKPSELGVDINVEKAWEVTTGSKDVVVAIIDTGIDTEHPDLKDNLWVNEKELNGKPGVDDDSNGYIDDIYGYNMVDATGDVEDTDGHGTHIAGIIGAKGNNDLGTAGINWKVRIMSLKFVGKHDGSLFDAVESIVYAVNMGAKIINISWGNAKSSKFLKQAIEWANEHGALVVASAGNDAEDLDKKGHFPGSYDLSNLIAVTALSPTGQLADFAGYGLNRVHVAAPGESIYSTTKNKDYTLETGSSFATPHVTGVAALALSVFPKLTPSELKSKLLSSVTPLPSLKGKVATGGIINAEKAVKE